MQPMLFMQFENTKAFQHRPGAKQKRQQVIPFLPCVLDAQQIFECECPHEKTIVFSQRSRGKEESGFALCHTDCGVVCKETRLRGAGAPTGAPSASSPVSISSGPRSPIQPEKWPRSILKPSKKKA